MTRWLFGDQLGPHFLDDDEPVLMIESKAVFARRRFHRAKAHLVLSAMRHRAAELGERCRYVRADRYAEVIAAERNPVTVCHPTSRAALRLVRALDVTVLPPRGFLTSMTDFSTWADGRRRLLLEDFYRETRRRHGILMDGTDPRGGRWNYDADNRQPPPASLTIEPPWWPTEDEIDDEVRHDLDEWERRGEVTFVGDDGPRRFAATAAEAAALVKHFLTQRLSTFGPIEDAMLADEPWMSHSLISAPMNLGLLDPLPVVQAAVATEAPLASVEGFVRQIIGWREYVWHLYWYEDERYRHGNYLEATGALPVWFDSLDANGKVEAACLSGVLADLRQHGWVHHIPRLMVLGNYAMQRGWRPSAVTDWFHRSFVDGYDWVMVPNVVGMSQFADGGVMATKPYAGGGAYIDRMSDYCGGCRYNPKVRVGDDACPFTAGYWAFLARNEQRLAGNARTAQSLRGLRRLKDLDGLVEQERDRGSRAP